MTKTAAPSEISIKLPTPIRWKDQGEEKVIAVLDLREPSAREVRIFQKHSEDMITAVTNVVSKQCGVPADLLEDLPWGVIKEASDFFNHFFEVPAPV